MTLTAQDGWTLATALGVTTACAPLGCFLVLRRMSMLGDAISHAILPGLALAFMISKSRDAATMLIGATVVGVATAVMSAGLARRGKVSEDAALGVVFTTMFALGVLLINAAASNVDLDPGCVLYGVIETVWLDMVNVGGVEVPRALVPLAVMVVVNIAAVAVFYKELKIVSFDAALATTMGISAGLVHYGLMTLVAATTVVSFEAVGSILVIAMLVAPAAGAHLLTDRLPRMLGLSVVLGAVSAVLGYAAAVKLETSVAGMIAVASGVVFAACAVAAPKHGVLARAARQTLLAVRIVREDLLAMAYRAEEAGRELEVATARAATGRRVLARAALWGLAREGRLGVSAGRLELREPGREEARRMVRTHRLWEIFLAEQLGLAPDHVHEPAHRIEHFISPDLAGQIARAAGAEGGQRRDPHGRDVPPAV